MIEERRSVSSTPGSALFCASLPGRAVERNNNNPNVIAVFAKASPASVAAVGNPEPGVRTHGEPGGADVTFKGKWQSMEPRSGWPSTHAQPASVAAAGEDARQTDPNPRCTLPAWPILRLLAGPC